MFDLDGVLVDSRSLHYEALNMALETIDKKYVISLEEHLAKYDANSTTNKLKMLTEEKGLPVNLHDKIWKLKQEATIDLINNMSFDTRMRTILRQLKDDGYTIYCASNSIWNTVKIMLLRKGLLEFFDYFISNQEVKHHKPNPEIYLKCVDRANVSPYECMIMEDSPIGREAAMNSGCHVCPIENPSDVTIEKIYRYIAFFNKQNELKDMTNKWRGNINIVIPMAGMGSRFVKQGYTFPKPLIEVNGKSMIQLVVDNLNIEGHYTFIVQKEHYDKFCLNYVLNLIAPNCNILCVDSVTEGAACTVLLAKKFVNNDMPLVIANSDQYLEWDSNDFLYSMMSDGVDAGISTFKATHPKWSYARLNDSGYVCEVAEKKPISNNATTGIYYWKKGSDFVKYAEQMISKNIRVNNEFYVCPVFNEAILDDKKIKIKDCEEMHGIGTPEDLDAFLMRTNNEKEFELKKKISISGYKPEIV